MSNQAHREWRAVLTMIVAIPALVLVCFLSIRVITETVGTGQEHLNQFEDQLRSWAARSSNR